MVMRVSALTNSSPYEAGVERILLRRERSVEGNELVALVLAHASSVVRDSRGVLPSIIALFLRREPQLPFDLVAFARERCAKLLLGRQEHLVASSEDLSVLLG